MERHFGNAAALTYGLLERLSQAADLGEKYNIKLQKVADLFADVNCQMTLLPGLACLNYPMALRLIVVKFPIFLKYKCEKQILLFADENDNAYPPFCELSRMLRNQAKKRNHSNITAGNPARTVTCTIGATKRQVTTFFPTWSRGKTSSEDYSSIAVAL